ncbi:hypothetical protein BX600DRAFT_429674 [Xylariales sp. PMI_506]|nr:hypothetical protein BX600DRAFT_429674 [Xylariales sp. PMI_506]
MASIGLVQTHGDSSDLTVPPKTWNPRLWLEVDPALTSNYHASSNNIDTSIDTVKKGGLAGDAPTTADQDQSRRYYLPTDGVEQKRLDLQHEMFRTLLDGALGLAPVENPAHVLDIGTGTGIWALDYATQHANTQVIGVDITLNQPADLRPPQNCIFVTGDSENPWNFEQKFDYVHLRAVTTCFTDTRTVMQNAFENLNEGGWVEFQDPIVNFYGFDNTTSKAFVLTLSDERYEHSKIKICFDAVGKAFESRGRDIRKPRFYKQWLAEAGFTDITEKILPIPMNPWPRDAKFKQVGRLQQENMESIIFRSAPKMLPVLGYSPEKASQIIDEAFKETSTTDIHAYTLGFIEQPPISLSAGQENNLNLVMAEGLSSNWKKLQAQIKADSPATTTTTATKRKAESASGSGVKRQRQGNEQAKHSARSLKPIGKPGVTKSKPMGTTQSSVVEKGSSSTVKPSLALWAEDNDISAESIAEAYGLGIKRNVIITSEKPRVNEGLAPSLELGKYVALDCEMVGIGPDGYDSVLARASLVDFHGRQIYDSFVRPKERVTDWRTKITGITPKQMASARDFDEVQQEVAELLKGRILVGHDIRHDLAVLMLSHPTTHIRDTSRFSGFRRYGHGPKPSLKILAKEVLGMEIQTGHHSSIEDAKVAMLLFRSRKSEFDMEHANKFEKPPGSNKPKPKYGKNKKR